MKLDKTQPLYILYGCNIVKERSTMRLVAATTDEEMLKVIIGSQILLGVMDYRLGSLINLESHRCKNINELIADLCYRMKISFFMFDCRHCNIDLLCLISFL